MPKLKSKPSKGPIKCRKEDCVLMIATPATQYCGLGHHQPAYKNNDRNEERHDDDTDDDDLVVCETSESWSKANSKARTIPEHFPVDEVMDLRDKAGVRDAKQKKKDKVKGKHGINPSNAPEKVQVSLWLVESPPAKPINTNILCKAKLDVEALLETPALVSQFIFNNFTLSGDKSVVPTLYDHKDLVSGELIIDYTRKAYIGSQEGSTVGWDDVSEKGKKLKDIIKDITDKKITAALPICIPVTRGLRKTVEMPSRKKPTHSRGESMPNLDPSVSKRSKKADKEKKVKQEREVAVKLEAENGSVVKEEVVKQEKEELAKVKEEVNNETETHAAGAWDDDNETEFPDLANLPLLSSLKSPTPELPPAVAAGVAAEGRARRTVAEPGKYSRMLK